VVLIRPMRLQDAEALRAFIERLSPASRLGRFQYVVKEATPHLLRLLLEVDPRSHVALGAFEDGVLLGEARYVRRQDPAEADFAIAVDDAWRGSGLAHLLLRDLMHHARRAGDGSGGVAVFRHRLDALGQAALGPLDEFVAHPAALFERAVAVHADGREVRENVGSAAFGLDEPESLGIVEPLDCANRHVSLPHDRSLILALGATQNFAGVPKRVKTVRPAGAMTQTPPR